MSDRSVTHTTFTLERVYKASPARVFAAWADPEAKARWFAGPAAEHELDFRIGGREVTRGHAADGSALTFESVYHDIIPDQRIVAASVLKSGDTMATVSVTAVELTPDGEGTRLLLTEQGTFLDGHEQPSWRQQGTLDQLTALEAELRR
ncbi:activator of HSP90 ATPase [Planotetraspora silvatica]|uniref:Activator of HSP90 ATPase n=1 Tax=Planotetraspora silvatica TaxID=234614 RepID=A0A8J3XQB6_9ACTN|nr:SRPBCC family protein [Planotetraspora silvatica]GII49249.1 activator of HSP90 ATPase [Planotetraspora silvatica]